jgi:hypothetical protein
MLTELVKKPRRRRIFSSLDRRMNLMHRVVKDLFLAISNLRHMNQHKLLQLNRRVANRQVDLQALLKVYLR